MLLVHKQVTAEEFEAAAMPHLHRVFQVATWLTGNRIDAEDLVQEVYLQAWKSFGRFELGTNCRAWLFTILSNKVKHYRRKKSKFKFADESEKFFETLTYEPPVPQQLCDEEILASLEKIPYQYREVLLLADVEEFSYKEVANILKIPAGTVMSRLNRGRKLLRSELSKTTIGDRRHAALQKTCEVET